MTDYPMLFSSTMVRAILDGTKTQTRRVVTRSTSTTNALWDALDLEQAFVDPGPSPAGNRGPYLKAPHKGDTWHRIYPRIGVGDRLWVRETWRLSGSVDPAVIYAADPSAEERVRGRPWRPSIFLPRWASRITLEVTAVRPERLQTISPDDAKAEGVRGPRINRIGPQFGTVDYVRNYQLLWDKLNAKRAPWTINPWVWVFTFRQVEKNHG